MVGFMECMVVEVEKEKEEGVSTAVLSVGGR